MVIEELLDAAADETTTASITLGTAFDGEIDRIGDQDWIAIELVAGQEYQIEVRGIAERIGKTLFDPDIIQIVTPAGGTLIPNFDNDAGLGFDARHRFIAQESGTYFISVGGEFDDIGTYQLTVEEALPFISGSDANIPFSGDGPILELDVPIGDALQHPGDQDSFFVELSEGMIVALQASGGDGQFDGIDDPEIIGVINTTTEEILLNVFDDDAGPGLDSEVWFTVPEDGLYEVVIGSATFSETGSYSLLIQELDDPGTGLQVGPTNPFTYYPIDFVQDPGDQLVAAIVDGIRWQNPVEGQPLTLTYSFAGDESVYTDEYQEGGPNDGFFGLRDYEQDLARQVFVDISEFAAIQFEEVADFGNSAGVIRFAWTFEEREDVAAYAYFPFSDPAGGDIWLINSNLRSFEHQGSFFHNTLYHEVGHALGLEHPFEGEVTLPTEFDSVEYTVMSYTFSSSIPNVTGSDLFPQSFQYLDILALRHLYGAVDTNLGNTVYSFDGTERHYRTLWDDGGIDTLRVENSSQNLLLDLTPGSWSDVGTTVTHFLASGGEAFKTETIFLPPEILIENAIGDAGNDILAGNQASNRLIGHAGSDTVVGGDGDDVIFAGARDDSDDISFGEGGSDTLGGAVGDDLLVGDVVTSDYFAARIDQLSSAQDTGGNDILFGGAGADTLIGGEWIDQDGNGLFTTVEADQSAGDSDTLWAGAGSDVVTGGGGADILGGGEGDDSLYGGAGADLFFGGDEASVGEGRNDYIIGGGGADTVFAAGGNDLIAGQGGDDSLFGGAGVDSVMGGVGADTLFGGVGNDILTGGAGADIFSFGREHDHDRITDFDVTVDILRLAATATDFRSLEDIIAAASETVIGGVSGTLIDLGQDSSVFLVNISSDDLQNINFVF